MSAREVDVNSAEFQMRPQWQQRILLKRTDSIAEKKEPGDKGDENGGKVDDKTSNGSERSNGVHEGENGGKASALEERRARSMQRSKMEDKVRVKRERTRGISRTRADSHAEAP